MGCMSDELIDEDDPGSVRFFRPEDLPGVEVLVAERSARRWVVLHHTYTVCTVRTIEEPAPLRYRRRIYDLASDSVAFMEPGEVHANPDVTAPATFDVLLIDPTVVEKAAAELGVPGSVHFDIDEIDGTSHPQVRCAFLALHDSLEEAATTLERESLLVRCLELVLEQCVERPAQPCHRSNPPWVRRARDFLEDNLTELVRLDDLVEAAGAADRFQLVRSFAAATGLPPHAYQIQRRIIISREMLAGGMRPADVATELGFADQSHFTRHFTRVVGTSPASYARALRRRASHPASSSGRTAGIPRARST